MKLLFVKNNTEAIIMVNEHTFGIPILIYNYLINEKLDGKVSVSVNKAGVVKLNLPLTYNEYSLEEDLEKDNYIEKPLSVTKSRKKEKLKVPSTRTNNIKFNKGEIKTMKTTTNFKNGDLICMVSTPRKEGEWAEKFRKMVHESIISKMRNIVYEDVNEIRSYFETEVLPSLEGTWSIEPTRDNNGWVAINHVTYTKNNEEKEGKNFVFLNAVTYDSSKVKSKKNDKSTYTKKSPKKD